MNFDLKRDISTSNEIISFTNFLHMIENKKKIDKNCIFVMKIETIVMIKIDVLIVKSINSIDKIIIVTIIYRSTTFMFFIFIIHFLIIILRIQFTIIKNINIAITIDN